MHSIFERLSTDKGNHRTLSQLIAKAYGEQEPGGKEIDILLQDLETLDFGSQQWLQKFKRLQELAKQHMYK